VSTATITSKGQITIPKDIRKALDLHQGEQVVFILEGERAFLYPVRSGAINRLRRPLETAPRFTSREAEREAARREAVANALGHDVDAQP
jgi:AbrB family looped-hinge helix DNA binding protein